MLAAGADYQSEVRHSGFRMLTGRRATMTAILREQGPMR
jgi:hypothetical protein